MSKKYIVVYSLTNEQDRELRKLTGVYNQKQGQQHSAEDFFRRMMSVGATAEVAKKLKTFWEIYGE